MTSETTTTEPTGAALIAAERDRQITVEGYTPDHDAAHDSGFGFGIGAPLALAAVCYAAPVNLRDRVVPWDRLWPWEDRFWKPSPDDRVRELVKAGALIAAEIDRLLGVSS